VPFLFEPALGFWNLHYTDDGRCLHNARPVPGMSSRTQGVSDLVSARSTDFLIIGGGIIGINLALEAKRCYPDCRVTLIEKEPHCGQHASGRNSGVLHAGFYYSAGSLKAQLTREGNRQLRMYCEERGLHLNRCGKLVVATHPAELDRLDELLRRAQLNGVELYALSAAEAREIEPRVRVVERALYSPTTSSVDPAEVVSALVADAARLGIDVMTGAAWCGNKQDNVLTTTAGSIPAGYVINAAGLQADRIAQHYGFGRRYRILPFKGLYLHARPGAPVLHTHVYPVPPVDHPFLGVHHTVTVDGRSMIGPTAIPCLWREQYHGLANFRTDEFLGIVARELRMLCGDAANFRRLAAQELRKYYRPHLVRQAARLLAGVQASDYTRRGTPGIRAQLFDVTNKRLETDFIIEGDAHSFHILNAVSPGFTCAMPFARLVLTEVGKYLP
jgi:L-2-hydroxyglutarate oxidase